MGKYDGEIPEEMSSIIKKCSVGLGAVGLGGGLIGPGADLVVLVPTWIGMTIALADEAGQAMDNQTAKKIAMAVCTGAGGLMAGTKLAATGIAWLTAPFTFGLSLLVSAGANAGLNATFTYAYGKAVARFFMKTTKISNVEVMVQILIALIGADLGFHTPYDHMV